MVAEFVPHGGNWGGICENLIIFYQSNKPIVHRENGCPVSDWTNSFTLWIHEILGPPMWGWGHLGWISLQEIAHLGQWGKWTFVGEKTLCLLSER